MGTLFWQLNDCWPGASWSSIDYYTNWKALQFAAKEAYKPLRLAVTQKDSLLNIYVLNDNRNISSGTLTIDIIGFRGEPLVKQQADIDFSFEKSTLVKTIDLRKLSPVINIYSSVLVARLMTGNEPVDTELHYFVLPKNLKLPESSLSYDVKQTGDHYVATFSSVNLEKDVAFYIPDVPSDMSENYFDLLPGEQKVVIIRPKTNTNKILEKGIVIHSLNKLAEIK
jgi:beta-mannosidase